MDLDGLAFVCRRRVATPNDPKLSDGGAWRGSCEGGAQREATDVGQRHDRTGRVQARIAATVTRGAVRCSAWLGAFAAFELPHCIAVTWVPVCIASEVRALGKNELLAVPVEVVRSRLFGVEYNLANAERIAWLSKSGDNAIHSFDRDPIADVNFGRFHD